MNISIEGAGIAGPAAALALIHAGHKVTVFEKRQPHQIQSFDVIGITEANCTRLRMFNVDLQSIALDNMYHEYSPESGMYSFRMSTQKFVVWTHVHILLTKAAERAGAIFKYGTEVKHAKITVHASGLAHARKRGLQPTPRYQVYRGLSPVPTDFSWLSFNDPAKRFSFKLAHTPHGSAWTLYVHRDNFPLNTREATELPKECGLLPENFQTVTRRTEKMIVSAISDWEVAPKVRDGNNLSIGDANGGLRPHTGSGANLAIGEALSLPALLSDTGQLEHDLITARREQHARGIAMGQLVMGV